MKKDKVIDLDDYRDDKEPFVVLSGVTAIHLIPLSVFESVATGELDVRDVEGVEDFAPTLVADILSWVGYDEETMH